MDKQKIHKVFKRRYSGVLLHPTSFPSSQQEGIFTHDAERFINFLCDAGFSIWQMLPVNATDQDASPYQGISVHAGNAQLISLLPITHDGWLPEAAVQAWQQHDISMIEVIAEARTGFLSNAGDNDLSAYEAFKHQQAFWLDDYAIYCNIKQLHDHRPWWQWPQALREREKPAMDSFNREYENRIEDRRFEQFVFYRQWQNLKKHANANGILLYGDMPILIAQDSVDVWKSPEYFKLDNSGQPLVVAGVPPDYYSSTGQRWGNPLYNWNEIAKDNFQWWRQRLNTQLQLFDIVRLDHFRGFVSLWEIPAHCNTAEQGQWCDVPGMELLTALQNDFGSLPLVAEDLGIITPEVIKLREDFNLPGMKILQFAFDSDNKNPYLPHNHEPFSVVYTGTHDNNTTLGWFYNLAENQQRRVFAYLQYPNEPMPWPLIYAALQSVCRIAVLPMQDLLALDGSHRMNTPGTVEGNWRWQFEWEWISPELIHKLRNVNTIYGRV